MICSVSGTIGIDRSILEVGTRRAVILSLIKKTVTYICGIFSNFGREGSV